MVTKFGSLKTISGCDNGHNIDRKYDRGKHLEGLDHETGCDEIWWSQIDKGGDTVMCSDVISVE